jgi:hypothetical protein
MTKDFFGYANESVRDEREKRRGRKHRTRGGRRRSIRRRR